MEKITRKAVVEKMLEMTRDELSQEEVEVVEKLVARLSKSGGQSEVSKAKEKAARKAAMDAKVEVLCGILAGAEDGMSCKDISAVEDTIFTGATSQKISAVAKAGINDGLIVKEYNKRVAIFKIA